MFCLRTVSLIYFVNFVTASKHEQAPAKKPSSIFRRGNVRRRPKDVLRRKTETITRHK